MQRSHTGGARRTRRMIANVISALLILALLTGVCAGMITTPVQRVRRIADRTVFSACALAAHLTARYDAEGMAERLGLDTDGTAIEVITAMSNLNTLSTREAFATCLRYRRVLQKLIDADSLSTQRATVMPFAGEAPIACTLYTLSPTKAQMTAFITTLAKNMETDGGLFVLARAFYTALMIVSQDATQVMAINSFETAWKSLSGADEAHIEATAERLLANNFPIALAAQGSRIYMLDAEFVFEESPVQLQYRSSGGVPGERQDSLSLVVEDTEMGLSNVCAFGFGEGLSGEFTATDNGETTAHAYGRARAAAGE